MAIDHSARAHAKLSASGSSKWINCPPSSRLENLFENRTSSYAEEGTVAHELSDIALMEFLQEGQISNELSEKRKQLRQSEYYNEDMQDYVDAYLDFIIERYNSLRQTDEHTVLMPEQRFDFSSWVPEGFGTGDVTIIGGGKLEIIDLKYGKGKLVASEGNTQMRLYALGAVHEYELLYPIETVSMTIYQPRLDNIETETISLKELLDWGDWVKPIARMAYEGKGEFKAGGHCGFCRAKNDCRARAEYHMALAAKEFRDPDLLEPDEVSNILRVLPTLTNWAEDVKTHALEQAEKHGVKYPGFKLVEGRSNRILINHDEAGSRLELIAGEEIYKPKSLLGITDLEKLIGKKSFSSLVGDLLIKPAGKPTLVEDTDKRPELSSTGSAQSEFDIIGD